jgi:glucan phosphoethanolaminetransferase (alkaline phosphatase superfamily)
LPAHPLFAHIPVVLIPLAAVGAVAMLWPRLRDRIGWVVVGIVFVAGICTQLAISSGQGLEEHVRESALVREHTEMGENIRPWVLLMFLALLAVMLLAHWSRRAEPSNGLRIAGVVASVLSIVFSAMAVYWIYRIGHSGSKAVWQPTQQKIDRGVSNEGGNDRD